MEQSHLNVGSTLPTCLLTQLAVSAVIKFVLNMGNEILVRKAKYASLFCVCICLYVYVCICMSVYVCVIYVPSSR